MIYGPALILRTEEREREGERKRGEREERKKGGKRVEKKDVAMEAAGASGLCPWQVLTHSD